MVSLVREQTTLAPIHISSPYRVDGHSYRPLEPPKISFPFCDEEMPRKRVAYFCTFCRAPFRYILHRTYGSRSWSPNTLTFPLIFRFDVWLLVPSNRMHSVRRATCAISPPQTYSYFFCFLLLFFGRKKTSRVSRTVDEAKPNQI